MYYDIGMLTTLAISFKLHTEPSVDPPEFTLTCRSRGGPATTVEWLYNNEPVEEDSDHMTSQVIVDKSSNTVYNNNLRVRGRQSGRYTCTISNNIADFFPGTRAQVSSSYLLQSEYMYIIYNLINFLILSCMLSCKNT